VLCGLAKFTTYSFSILCFTNSGDGPGTQPIQLRTLEDRPGEISDVSFNNVYDTSLEIDWRPPVEPNGKILAYVISYRPLLAGNATKFEQVVLDASQTRFTLRNLKQTTEYMIGIKAKTKAGDGQVKYTQIKSGVPPELPEPPKAIVLRRIGKRDFFGF
jgi:protein sidekick